MLSLSKRPGALLAAPAAIVLAAAAAYAIGEAVLASAPVPEQPGFVDTVLASRAVVAAIRLAIIFAGVFVVLSVIALIARGQWLTRIGPVQVSGLDTENARLEKTLQSSEERVDVLRGRLAVAEEGLGILHNNRSEERK
ncbi:MAG TPA: hypothetical protein VGV69_04915 [Solirubrobacterales bacterium]|nr:hypothetical protein [Solirubrobacterales bacterium]